MFVRRTIRRYLPVLCAVILLRIYVIKQLENEVNEARIESYYTLGNAIYTENKNLSQEYDIFVDEENQSSLSHNIVEEETVEYLYERRNDPPRSKWVKVDDNLYTYSGFWDTRAYLGSPTARVLGILRYSRDMMEPGPGFKVSNTVKAEALKYSCYLWYEGFSDPIQGKFSATVFEEGLKVFTGTFFFCQRSNQTSFTNVGTNMIPYGVSIVPASGNYKFANIVMLSSFPSVNVTRGGSSAVCVRPLFGPYSDVHSLAQFLAYYATVLNISHFYFYDHEIDKNVKKFLYHVINDVTMIEIFPWNVPTSDWGELWDLGSLTALNDCIYYSIAKHDKVAIVDLDEFIVPRFESPNLNNIYKRVLSQKRGNNGDAVLIRNAFFCHEFHNQSVQSDRHFEIFENTMREARIWPTATRSKMIVDPESVVSLGHHMIHHFVDKSMKNHGAPRSIALLHHYRTCAGLTGGKRSRLLHITDDARTKDASILRFKQNVLTSGIMKIYNSFRKI